MARKQGGKGRPFVSASSVVLGAAALSQYNSGQYVLSHGGRTVRMAKSNGTIVLVPRVNEKPMSMAAFRQACGKAPKEVLPVVAS
jgi:hypothetical protein